MVAVIEPPEVLTPQQAARALGVSPSGLRRLASIYERERGELPREGPARVWPRAAVVELKHARELVADRRAASIEAALQIEAGTVDVSAELEPAADGQVGGEVERLLRELVNENRAMRDELRALRAEVAELRALPAAKDETDGETARGGFWERFRFYWRRG